jgi:ATP-binding cassette subfamily B protein
MSSAGGAVPAEQADPVLERAEPLALLETDVSEAGRWERRTVALTADALEVTEPDGTVLRRLPLFGLRGVEIRETGGGAWLEAVTASGQPVRLAFGTPARIAEMRVFRDKVSAQLKGEAAPAGREAPAPDGPAVRRTLGDRFRTAAELARYAAPHRREVLVLGAVMLIAALLEALPPYLMKPIVDGGVLSSSPSAFAALIGLLAAVYVLQAAFQLWRASIGIRIGSLLVERIRRDMFDKLMTVPLRYYERRKTAPYIGRIQHDAEWVQQFFSAGFAQLPAQLVLTAAVLAMMFALDWRLALALLALLPPGVLLLAAVWPRLRSLTGRRWNAEYDLQQRVAEALQGIRVIKAFRREEEEKRAFAALNAAAIERMKAGQLWTQRLQTGLHLAISCGIALAWYLGGRRVMAGEATLGSVMAFTTYLSLFLGHLHANARAFGWTNTALAAADRILDLLRAESEAAEEPQAIRLPRVTGEIRVERMSFSYEPGRRALADIDLHIRPGERIGIVGRSGAGKTTLIHLLCRFYDPDAGSIRIDDIDLRRIARADLHRHIGIVFQETYLFDGTIGENIAYGCPGATPEQIVQAAVFANAHAFITRLPYGYDTPVGERGVQLSGGEKQRISIARTLLSNPSVLILDEATASVDAETEKDIQEALDRLARGRTTIAVAHRMSALRRVDRIYVLDGGRIAEAGTPEELAERDGVYRRLLRTQQAPVLSGEGAT